MGAARAGHRCGARCLALVSRRRPRGPAAVPGAVPVMLWNCSTRSYRKHRTRGHQAVRRKKVEAAWLARRIVQNSIKCLPRKVRYILQVTIVHVLPASRDERMGVWRACSVAWGGQQPVRWSLRRAVFQVSLSRRPRGGKRHRAQSSFLPSL